MTPRRLIELTTDNYWIHEWFIPLTFIAVVIMVLTFIIAAAFLFWRMKQAERVTRERDRAQAARLDALLKDRELNYP